METLAAQPAAAVSTGESALPAGTGPGRAACAFSCSMTNRVGACTALMEGLGGPTPDQPLMAAANRRVSVFT
jgi:hypothetical protein